MLYLVILCPIVSYNARLLLTSRIIIKACM